MWCMALHICNRLLESTIYKYMSYIKYIRMDIDFMRIFD